MSDVAPIALRTRKSHRDARVTLVTLCNELEHSGTNLATSPHPTELTKQESPRRSGSSDPDAVGKATRTTTPKKRRRSIDPDLDDVKSIDALEGSPSKSSRKSTPTKLRPKLVDAHPEPARWRETYDIIRRQRETLVAAVDLMGCDAIAGSKDEYADIPDRDRRLSSLISLMLSSQTKDPVTHDATMNLRRNLSGGLCLEGILAASDAEIHACINKVGFWRRKTDYIRRTAEILRDKFDGDVPKTIEDLLILPGVGPKMAYLCLQSAWGIHEGIGVDTHVHRITNRLGWHRKPTTDPEETRVNLESWLPKELFNHINIMLVGLGQTVCLPINPRCDLCHLGQMEDSPCPSKRKVLVKQAKAKRKTEELPSGEVGLIADTLQEVKATNAVQEDAVKQEIAQDFEPSYVEQNTDLLPPRVQSRYFVPKQEPDALAW